MHGLAISAGRIEGAISNRGRIFLHEPVHAEMMEQSSVLVISRFCFVMILLSIVYIMTFCLFQSISLSSLLARERI